MVAGVRTATGIAAIAGALIGMEKPLSWWWLIPVLAGVALWTAFYAVTAWNRGLHAWLIGIDVFLACLMCLAIGKLVPAATVPGSNNWAADIASMVAISAQLAGNPLLSVPAGLLVAVSLGVGESFAHAADGGVIAALILSAQTVIAALVMTTGIRIEDAAVRAFTDLEQEQTAAVLSAARREDWRAQMRLVHNGPVTTLTMALQANAERLSPALRQRAASARQDLLRLAFPLDTGGRLVRLDERLAQVTFWHESQIKIATILPACSVPSAVAEAFTKAAREALENAARYAGTGRAQLELSDSDRMVRVRVTDRGHGFDVDQVSSSGFGLREDIIGRMRAVGGEATVNSSPGAGTVVDLEWRRD
jgi:anti-sigma regulatory factor (Ser/Thr protein kinase)